MRVVNVVRAVRVVWETIDRNFKRGEINERLDRRGCGTELRFVKP